MDGIPGMMYDIVSTFGKGDFRVKNISMYAMIAADMARVETELLTTIQTPVTMLQDFSVHLSKAGGKRLRPALYLLCARQSASPSVSPIAIAAAIELIHMATLIHDDVIDKSPTRRGIPTANALWGNHAAVLGGDFLFARAFSLVATEGDYNIIKILADVICALSEGEIIQMAETFNADQTEEGYYARIAKKTAEFIAGSIQCGALTADMTAEDVAAMRQFGYDIGMAFQIIDDILDITASSAQIGKPVANDLRQGVITLPVIHAIHHGPRGSELQDIIRRREMTASDIEICLTIMEEASSVPYSYRQVARYLDDARFVLPASLDKGIRAALLEVADFVGLRQY